MAKKSAPLSFRAIVLGAEADIIRQALEARVQIDQLIEERQRAYERIAAIETQVEDIIGEQGAFPFPLPPLPIAGIDPKQEVLSRSPAPARKPGARPSTEVSAGSAVQSAESGASAVSEVEEQEDAANS